MALYFRKSFRSGPFRVNFSKSGVSYSVGVKGARITSGNRGTYVTVGGNGIYYRQRLSPPASAKHERHQPAPATAANILHTITSADIDKLTDADSQDFINELTEKAQKISFYHYLGKLPLIATILCFFYCLSTQGSSGSFPWFFFILIFVAFPFWLKRLKRIDKERLMISIHYEMEGGVKEIYADFIRHFAAIKSSARIWQYLHTEKTSGYKYSGGASNSISRRLLTNVATNRFPLKWFDTNVEIPYLGLTNTELYFFPERLIIKRQNKFAAVMYKNMNCSFCLTRFIEEESVSGDSEVVGYTWKYLNKNGTPDKRFSNNRQLPICRYSEYHISSESGVNEVITTSKAGVFDDFVKLINTIGQLQLRFEGKVNSATI